MHVTQTRSSHSHRFVTPVMQSSMDRRATLASAAATEEKFAYQAETDRLMDMIVNSLYSNKEVFLRELVSNASDALDKVRITSLTDPDVLKTGTDLEVRIKVCSQHDPLQPAPSQARWHTCTGPCGLTTTAARLSTLRASVPVGACPGHPAIPGSHHTISQNDTMTAHDHALHPCHTTTACLVTLALVSVVLQSPPHAHPRRLHPLSCLQSDKESNTIVIEDTGIGMTKEDLLSSLGTIARSGTAKFAEAMKQAQEAKDSNLIGQFGVGFYSSFLVADRVTVQTKHNDDKQWAWESTAGSHEYSVREEPDGDLARGTRCVPHACCRRVVVRKCMHACSWQLHL